MGSINLGSNGTITNLAVGGLPDGTVDNDTLANNASDSAEIAAGAVDLAHLSATGTASSSTFLRGDNAWAEPAGGGGADDLAFTATGKGITWTANSSTGYIKANTASGHDMEFNVGGNLNQYQFKFGGTEKMRWHSNSTLAWGSSPSTGASNGYNTNQGVWLYGAAVGSDDIVIGTVAVSADGAALILNRSDTANGTLQIFRKGGSTKGTISIDSVSTAYNTSSDYRLKQDEVAISDGITRLKQLKPYRFKWKADTSKFVDGFFAHEVTPTVPEAIFGEKDAMKGETFYEEGDTLPSGKKVGDVKTYSSSEIDPQQIDQAKLVPLLTAALQEAITKIETLETKVAALEAG
jgi:hypothetical protein